MLTVIIFAVFVLFTLGLSSWLGRRAKTASGYFAAHGQVGWFVNGVAFAGDYLSAASFLGICGLIAFYGYDGFLYSIGFLAGWVVALFVIAEPIKRLGKFTFADALSAKFGKSRGITLAAAISTLVVSTFYLIPQMVGAGSLIKPLLNLSDLTLAGITIPSHSIGVVIVGGVVITIVVTAGMVSTTWVQFIKGSLLVVFCAVLVVAILARGITETKVGDEWVVLADEKAKETAQAGGPALETRDSGALGPAEFLQKYSDSTIVSTKTGTAEGNSLLLPGSYFKGIRSDRLADRLDFASLMLALFCGTAALPHILIRYYTVKDSAAARKSTVVGIISIGFFYILTLYVGLGATVSGNLDPLDSNMSAPLLAKTFGELPFAFISAIAFTTVLGTVSGLILAASGAVAHDLIEIVGGHRLNEHAKVGAAKWAALGIGIVAIVLGILFRTFNASFLVGWAFNIAASANLPALVMLLFWKRTTAKGIAAAVVVGMVSSLAWILLSQQAFRDVFGVDPSLSPIPFSQPALVTVPLGFITLIIVSLLTKQQDYTSAPPRPFEVIQK